MTGRVLVVEDDAALRELLAEGLPRRGFEVTACAGLADALAALEQADPDVVVTDLNLGGPGGLELCGRLASSRPDLPVVVITAFGSLETAVAALRAGAYDFVAKPFDLDALRLTLERAVRHRALREEVRRLRLESRTAQPFEELLGRSPPMLRVYDLLERAGPSASTVLVTGESGTGKELAARALHQRSARAAGPFVAVNCAALPEALLESELFGHVRGAFTDARAARPGLFVQADGGTLFLDEIGELPAPLQAKLLRALQERRVRPVGADQEVAFDVRLIAATNRDLETAVEERRFREDLFYRINVIRLDLPPLRERGSDVLLLAHRLLERFAAARQAPITGFSPQAAALLLAWPWPGNVRELENCVEQAVALARWSQIGADDLPAALRQHRPSHVLVTAEDASQLLPMAEVERRYILRVLEAAGGNKSRAAQILGFDRTTLYRKLERLGQGGEG